MIQLNHQQSEEKFKKESFPERKISFFLCGVSDWRNIAGVRRLADAIATNKIFLDSKSFKVFQKYEKKIIRAGRQDSAEFEAIENPIEFLKEISGQKIAVEITSQSQSIFDFKNAGEETLLLVGNEQHGVSEEILNEIEIHLHVPMLGVGSSMNVAMALGIASYELLFR